MPEAFSHKKGNAYRGMTPSPMPPMLAAGLLFTYLIFDYLLYIRGKAAQALPSPAFRQYHRLTAIERQSCDRPQALKGSNFSCEIIYTLTDTW